MVRNYDPGGSCNLYLHWLLIRGTQNILWNVTNNTKTWSVFRIGTAALAVQVVGSNWPKPHYTLLVTGLCRFQILQLLKEKPYPVAEVEQLDRLEQFTNQHKSEEELGELSEQFYKYAVQVNYVWYIGVFICIFGGFFVCFLSVLLSLSSSCIFTSRVSVLLLQNKCFCYSLRFLCGVPRCLYCSLQDESNYAC